MFHHVAIATRDVKASHEFYTGPMGFKLVRVEVAKTDGGYAKHLFYETGGPGLFALWDLHDPTIPEFQPAISSGLGLPFWINHIAFHAEGLTDLEKHKLRWLEHGLRGFEVDHGWCTSIYTMDPNGNLVEFCATTRAFTEADHADALRKLADPSPELPDPPPAKVFSPKS